MCRRRWCPGWPNGPWGYPLFVIGLLRALIEEGADLTQPRLARVPESLAGRVALLVDRLDPPDRELLEVLAVIGGRVDPDGLARVLGQPLDRLGIPLERLTRSRLVGEYEAGHRLSYEIAHPLVQDAVYESIGGARRRTFHRLVGRALVAVGQLRCGCAALSPRRPALAIRRRWTPWSVRSGRPRSATSTRRRCPFLPRCSTYWTRTTNAGSMCSRP